MTATALHDDRYLGISEVAESTGFSLDTLRWYEREGLFPRVERDSSRRRRYSPREVSLLRTLARLRRTGMPTREMREFTRLVTEGAATHGQRLALLAAHRDVRLTMVKNENHTDWDSDHEQDAITQVADFITAHIAPAKLAPIPTAAAPASNAGPKP